MFSGNTSGAPDETKGNQMKTDNTNTAQVAITLAVILLGGLILFQTFFPMLSGLMKRTSAQFEGVKFEQVLKA